MLESVRVYALGQGEVFDREAEWVDQDDLVVARAARAAAGEQLAMPSGTPAIDGALSPDGRTLALVRGGGAPGVVLARLDRPRVPVRPLLSGAGVGQATWSPDGRWLLVNWTAANQWVFIRVAGTPRIHVVSRIAQQFSAGAGSGKAPALEGWCCTARGRGR